MQKASRRIEKERDQYVQKIVPHPRIVSDTIRRIELHILVNNAGSNWGAPYDEYPDAAWTRVLTLNLQRVFTITQLLTPLLEAAGAENDPARVINIGSVDGLRVPTLETL
jgi:NAD(P)-dependent dehydrogenase (short-subunit alcohol dehydrogenase family)